MQPHPDRSVGADRVGRVQQEPHLLDDGVAPFESGATESHARKPPGFCPRQVQPVQGSANDLTTAVAAEPRLQNPLTASASTVSSDQPRLRRMLPLLVGWRGPPHQARLRSGKGGCHLYRNTASHRRSSIIAAAVRHSLLLHMRCEQSWKLDCHVKEAIQYYRSSCEPPKHDGPLLRPLRQKFD